MKPRTRTEGRSGDVAAWEAGGPRSLGHRVRARATIVASADGPGNRTRFDTLRSEPPITLRPTPDALYIVGSGAGPLGGDELRFDITVGAHACVDLASIAAQIVLPGPTGERSHQITNVVVGPGATLRYRPEPVIAVEGCDHVATTVIALASDATLVWEESIVLGRHGEGPGSILQRLRIDRGGSALHRNDLAFGPRYGGWNSGVVLGGHRCLTTELLVGPGAGVDAALAERTKQTMSLGSGAGREDAAMVLTLS
ncbi:MAG: urease accessory protein UreD [Actinobacteria bacterium]|nr:urease accessory protein UreD [Actinomycetota bacterium]